MTLHPQAKAFLDELAANDVPGWEELTPDQGREAFAGLGQFFGQGPSVERVEDQTVADGVAVRVYVPAADRPLPGLLYFHGGGWVLGDLDTHDALSRRLAAEANCVVVAVDYRRAPEHKFPAALDDSFAAAAFVAENAARFNVDCRKLVVAGDSAGGNLALNVARRARDQDGPEIRFQLLIYPVVERNFDTSSYCDFAEGYGLTRSAMMWFWDQYVEHSTDGPYLSVTPTDDLAGLPATHIITCEYDVLRDEGESLGRRLSTAGVPVTVRRYDGMIHGFVHFSGLFEEGSRAVSDAAQVVKDFFER